MLHRAWASISTTPLGSPEEVLVFFEHACSRSRIAALISTLASVWCVDQILIDVWDFDDESTLLGPDAIGGVATGDARLFEIDKAGDDAVYADESRTLLLVRPATTRRLVAAQRQVRELQKAQMRRVVAAQRDARDPQSPSNEVRAIEGAAA